MKKRILALALAGTTAFSVFGAAMSANAATSTHVWYGNDAYTSYEAGKIEIIETAGANVPNVYQKVADNNYTTKYPYLTVRPTNTYNAYKAIPAIREAALTTGIEAANVPNDKGLGYVKVPNPSIYVDTNFTVRLATAADPAANTVALTGDFYVKGNSTDTTVFFDGTLGTIANLDNYVNQLNAKIAAGTVTGATDAQIAAAADARQRLDSVNYFKLHNSLTAAVDEYIKQNGGYSELYATATSTYTTSASYKATATGVVDADPLSRNGNEVVSGEIYAYDYFSYAAGPAALAAAYDQADMRWNGVFTEYESTRDAAELATVVRALSTDDTLNSADAVKNPGYFGGYFSNRADVITEFEDFMYDLGLLVYNNSYNLTPVANTVYSEADLLAAYSYKVNGVDVYNFAGLIHDLYTAKDNYDQLSSSNLVYLMQQYDHYVDGSFISGNELNGSNWADLLISCLEAVDAEDFKSGYTGFARQATAAINEYNAATTAAKQEAAIAKLYAAVVGSNGRSAGVDKAELAATLNSLYFNNKNIPTTYTAAAATSTNASLTMYGYAEAQKVVGVSVAPGVTSAKAVYPLYPQADYLEKNNTITTYKGNTGAYAGTGTDAYEWFVNVYELAAKVNAMNNNGSYQGIVDTVNAALEDAVAALVPTATPAGSTSLRLEEAVEKYADKIDTDYAEAYFNAYEEANAFAEIAEGDLATKYAIEMVIISGETLGYQSVQTTVTKGDIKDLTTAIANAEKALKALKADKDNYNASQVVALNNAIAEGQAIVDKYNGKTADTVNKNTSKAIGDKDSFVRSDVEAAMTAIDDAIAYKEVIQGWAKDEATGKYYYGKGDKYLNDGWNQIGSTWYYFNEDGTAKQSEWFKDEDGKWYYLNANCGAAYGWAKVNNEWYYFNNDNSLRTGWIKSAGHWYYLSTSESTLGEMVTGWAEIDGKWYYFSKEENAVGQMLANTTTPDGYTVDANGVWVK